MSLTDQGGSTQQFSDQFRLGVMTTYSLPQHYPVVAVAHSLRVGMAALSLTFFIFICQTLLPPLIPGLTLHKCCQRGELLSLHSKECIADRLREGEENITLTVFTTPTKEHNVEHLVTFDYVALDRCQTKQKVNLRSFDVYEVGGQLRFFNRHAPELIDPETACFDRALDSKTNSESFVAQKCLDCSGGSSTSNCLNFCCPEGFTKINNTCLDQPSEDNTTADSGLEYLSDTNFTYVSAELHCVDNFKFDIKQFSMKEDGLVEIDGGLHETSEYCLDQFGEQWGVLLCQKEPSQKERRRTVTKVAVMSVSILALLLVILLHLLIEGDIARPVSHWSSSYNSALSLVESFIVMLRQLSYAIKSQLKPPKNISLL